MFDRVSEVLPLVTKPIRYTGGEYNALVRDAGPERVQWVLAMPEVYELGMSNYGLRVLYSIINRLDNALCERCFLPWPDFGSALSKQNLPLYTLESKRPVKEFDILGISLQSELSYTNVLYLLELAQIPLHRQERGAQHPLVIAGGPCTVNPLPLVDFFDAFVVGDGEEPVREITDRYVELVDRGRDELLTGLAQLPGLFVPGRTVRRQGAVKRRFIAELKEEDFPFPPVLPICETTHDRLTIEIARGCTRGCRFCQAGIINRPVRFRSVEQIVRLAERGIRATGWEEVSLLALSALDFPDIENLTQQLSSRLSERRVSLSLPSTRGEDFTPSLALDLQEVKKAGLTFAPETASPRLKALVNKDIPEAAVLESIRTALDAGWHGVKLYFLVGLPGETDADLDEIARFVNEISRLCRNRSVRCNLSPLVPKPHTPLQWVGYAGIEANRAKVDRLKGMLSRRNIKLKWENPECSFVQAALARADERAGPVLERVYRKGGIFQEWSEWFRLDTWLAAWSEQGVDPLPYTTGQPLDAVLPWDFIDVGVSRDFLRREHERAERGEKTPDCARAECVDCGVCPDKKPPDRPEPSPPELVAYGRKSRPRHRRDEALTRHRLKYSVGDQYRFAAHLDRVRALYRALRRSELPVAYTLGYAPKPMLSFGPPLPVGLASEGEYVDVFASAWYSGNMARDLGPFLPRGLRIAGARMVLAGVPALGKAVNLGRYQVRIPEDIGPRVPEILAQGQGIPGVRNLALGEDNAMMLDIAIAPGLRLFTVLGQLLGIDEGRVRCLEVRRLDCLIDIDGKTITPMEG